MNSPLYVFTLFSTGGEIVSTFDNPDQVKLGQCDLIEEVIIGEDRLIKFSGVKLGEACTIILRGATQQILDEADRSLHDALCVLAQTVKETKTVYGGGRKIQDFFLAKESIYLIYHSLCNSGVSMGRMEAACFHLDYC